MQRALPCMTAQKPALTENHQYEDCLTSSSGIFIYLSDCQSTTVFQDTKHNFSIFHDLRIRANILFLFTLPNLTELDSVTRTYTQLNVVRLAILVPADKCTAQRAGAQKIKVHYVYIL